MTAVVHRTPGLLDIRALTTMGLSAKPRSGNPIGMFGTGLKYAIATLCRLGCSPVVWIGRDKYTFVGRPGEFRGQEYVQIKARLERPSLLKPRYITLPYTTQYGLLWQPWMAFRELHSNTLDEGGETYEIDGDGGLVTAHLDRGRDNETHIIVDLPAYVEAHRLKHETFLPDGAREGTGVQIIERAARSVYWRGLRVLDLPETKCAAFTYNILDKLELTEDRTLKHEVYARWALAQHLVAREERAEVIRKVLVADGNHWEHRLDLDYAPAPTELFKQVAEQVKEKAPWISSYVSRYVPTPAGRTPWERHPRPWHAPSGEGIIVDANGRIVIRAPAEPPKGWYELARVMCNAINRGAPVKGVDTVQEDEIPL